MGSAGEEGLEGVGRSGRGARRWQKEDPGALNHPPYALLCMSLILPTPLPFSVSYPRQVK